MWRSGLRTYLVIIAPHHPQTDVGSVIGDGDKAQVVAITSCGGYWTPATLKGGGVDGTDQGRRQYLTSALPIPFVAC